jgi:hypothetical protein
MRAFHAVSAEHSQQRACFAKSQGLGPVDDLWSEENSSGANRAVHRDMVVNGCSIENNHHHHVILLHIFIVTTIIGVW